MAANLPRYIALLPMTLQIRGLDLEWGHIAMNRRLTRNQFADLSQSGFEATQRTGFPHVGCIAGTNQLLMRATRAFAY